MNVNIIIKNDGIAHTTCYFQCLVTWRAKRYLKLISKSRIFVQFVPGLFGIPDILSGNRDVINRDVRAGLVSRHTTQSSTPICDVIFGHKVGQIRP